PSGELVQPDLVRLRRMPGEVQPPWALVHGTDTVLPSIARDEVAAGVADGRHTELFHQVGDIVAESVLIGRRVPGLIDAVVDAPTEVLHERAEEPTVDRADHEVRVDGQMCRNHFSSRGGMREAGGGAGRVT